MNCVDPKDEKLVSVAKLAGYSYGGYQRHARGYQYIFWTGLVGDVQRTVVARKKMARWITTIISKIK